MNYTVNQLAKLSGVTIRTLHFYDEIGLLKPAYVTENGYRYYQKSQLLILQQILFFKELGFELKQIQDMLLQTDFDKVGALLSHKKMLKKNIVRLQQLLKTIDNTIIDLKGKKIMKDQEIFYGFDSEKQNQYEESLINRYGDKIKKDISASKTMIKNWTKANWDKAGKEFDEICKDLVTLINKKVTPDSGLVQKVIARHFTWIKQFWTPNKESYIGLGFEYTTKEWEKTFNPYHEQLAQFFYHAIQVYAQSVL